MGTGVVVVDHYLPGSLLSVLGVADIPATEPHRGCEQAGAQGAYRHREQPDPFRGCNFSQTSGSTQSNWLGDLLAQH